jgi:serine/threonine-protein kinase
MGTVHLARDTVLGRLVAVKVLADHLAADEAFRHRFVRESCLTARLCHPNVVQVFDAGGEDQPFLVMEYVDGETVAARLARHCGFSGDELVTLALHLSAGLAHAHARGIVHRDVKPHNVLLRRDGMAKLTDFGIAKALEESGLTESGSAVGKARFTAPEQAAGEAVGPPADVYALGALLRHAGGGALPPELDSLVEACLLPQPGARPSAAALHQRLADLAGTPEMAMPETPLPIPTAGADPTEVVAVEPTEVAPAPVAPAPISPARPADSPRFGWPVIVAAAILLVLLALFVGGEENGGRAEAAPVDPVPTASDPAQAARNLAGWLRDSVD